MNHSHASPEREGAIIEEKAAAVWEKPFTVPLTRDGAEENERERHEEREREGMEWEERENERYKERKERGEGGRKKACDTRD